MGYEPAAERVWYKLWFRDQSGRAAHVFHFDLSSASPNEAIRDTTLEHPDAFHPTQLVSDRWKALMTRVVPLVPSHAFDLALSVRADSLGLDPGNVWRMYRLSAVVEALGNAASFADTSYCSTVVDVSGVYRVPGRTETVVVVSYSGRSDGCDRVDRPLLMRAK